MVSTSVDVTPDRAVAEQILRLRFAQMIINEHYKKGDFTIPIHLAMGHEAIAVATARVMRDGDRLVLPHRNIHYNLARGATLTQVLDEFFLRPGGLAGARLGSMNLSNPAAGIAYASSILGNNLGVAAGLAFGQQRLRQQKAVTIVVTGDGAIEEGAFSEMLTVMTTYGLAAIVVVENNGWSLATHISERRCDIRTDRLVSGFGLEYRALAGNDVFAYTAAIEDCRARAIETSRPIVVEVAIHSLGDRRQPAEGYPDGRYINYHAGPASTVAVTPWPVLCQDCDDPVFVLKDYFAEDALRHLAAETLHRLEEEIR
jgi:TPP-dependent pyruvate/acetoin dehydrogenase alpha subunit